MVRVTKPEQLKALAKKMKPNHLKMAKSLSEGATQDAAYIGMGGKGKEPKVCASKLISTNPIIRKYSDLAKEIAAESAQSKGIATFEAKAAMLWRAAELYSKETVDEDGNKIMVDPKVMKESLAELNKMSGDLASIKTESKHSFTDASKDELERKLAELQSQL